MGMDPLDKALNAVESVSFVARTIWIYAYVDDLVSIANAHRGAGGPLAEGAEADIRGCRGRCLSHHYYLMRIKI